MRAIAGRKIKKVGVTRYELGEEVQYEQGEEVQYELGEEVQYELGEEEKYEQGGGAWRKAGYPSQVTTVK